MCALYNVYAPISTRLWKFSANKVFYFPPSPLHFDFPLIRFVVVAVFVVVIVGSCEICDI